MNDDDLTVDYPEAAEVRRLTLHPGDVVILRVSGPMTAQQGADLRARFIAHARIPNPVVVMSADIEVDVLTPDDEVA